MKVIFIGLSNKIGKDPLASDTISGALVDDIINKLNMKCIKTNLVTFAPLDCNGKLRYPNEREKNVGFVELKKLYLSNKPCILVCLGNKVFDFLDNKLENLIKIKHPSYIAVYRRNSVNDYIVEASDLIKTSYNSFLKENAKKLLQNIN